MTGRQRSVPAYLSMLGLILGSYALIISVGDSRVGAAARLALLGALLWYSTRVSSRRRLGLASAGVTGACLAGLVASMIAGPPRFTYGLVGVTSGILIILVVASIVAALLPRRTVDTSTVLGVLCIYLLLALLFASTHQVCAAVIPEYLQGATDPPSASDLLYFSVITFATVGFGDLTPGTDVARAVTVVEALTGQLYLVSVVAAVVATAGARRRE